MALFRTYLHYTLFLWPGLKGQLYFISFPPPQVHINYKYMPIVKRRIAQRAKDWDEEQPLKLTKFYGSYLWRLFKDEMVPVIGAAIVE